MNLTAIACMSSNRVIGAGGGVPWYLPEDLRYFRKVTMGHTVIMGRRTADSLPRGMALRSRRNILLSRSLADIQGFEVVRGPEGIGLSENEKAFVIGGAETYRLLMPWTTEVLLTVFNREVEGDTFMPEFEWDFGEPEVIQRQWPVVEWRRYIRKDSPDCDFQKWIRNTPKDQVEAWKTGMNDILRDMIV